MPYKIDIYIGSDNNTRKISRDYLEKLKNWASKVFPAGYTLLKGRGFYNGSSEDSVIVTILSSENLSLKGEIELLKRALGQEAILLSRSYIELEVL
jgi:uncharacterized membrane-anchored protein YitT (DUF2179 family)